MNLRACCAFSNYLEICPLIAKLYQKITHSSATQRNEFLLGVRDMLPQLVGIAPFGLVTGVACVAAGMTPIESIALSLWAFSGIAQLVLAQLYASAAPWPITLAALAIVSARLAMYSAAISPYLAHLSIRKRWLMAYFLTDQGFAYGVAHYKKLGDTSARHWHFMGVALPSYLVWQITVAIGSIVGAQIPTSWSLDFAITLSFLILIPKTLLGRPELIAAAVAGAAALIASGLPFRLSLLLATLFGIAAGMLAQRSLGTEMDGSK